MGRLFRSHLILGSIPQLPSLPSAFNPSSISGLNVHLKADAIAGLTDGQSVSSWLDSSGNGNNANAGGAPIFKTNILNGKPVVRFDGSSQYLIMANSVMAGITNAITVFIVNTVTSVKTHNIFVAQADDGANRINVHNPWVDNNVYWDFGNTGAGGRVSTNWGGSLNTFYPWTYCAGGGSMFIRRGYSQIVSLGSSSTFNSTGKTLQLYRGDSGYQGGDVAEFLVYNRKLTTSEITQVENYLAEKYNLIFNLSQGLTATVNRSYGVTSGTIAMLTDGNTNYDPYLYGTPDAGLTYVQLDLGRICRVSSVKMWHYWADARLYHSNKLEISEDGTNWTTVFDSAVDGEYVEVSAGKTVSFSLRNVRYVRNTMNGSNMNVGSHWNEIQVWGF